MTTMISSLPRDLIEEILSRVPLKSIRAVQLTCKTWNTLSKSESFVKMHIGKATTSTREGEFMMITMMNDKLYLMSVVVDKVDPYIETKGKLTCLTCDGHQVKISQVFHCEGLLLCILKDDTTTRLVVWNPYCGETRWIKPRYSHHFIEDKFCTDMFNYSLGYENKNSRRFHKFLRFIDHHRFGWSFMQYPKNNFFCYEIYDFDSDLWTTLDVDPHWFIPYSHRGVTLKGNTYWSAGERSDGYSNHIICFDFTKERFGPLLPPPSSVWDHAYLTLSCVREEKLAGLFQRHESYKDELEIWITTKLEAEMVSWSKFLRVDTGPLIHWSFVIDEEKKLAMGFNDNRRTLSIIGDAGYSRELLDLGEHAEHNNYWPQVCSYVPSFVQIKEPTNDNWKKRQSSLETRRFEGKMMRLSEFEKAVPKYQGKDRLVTIYEA